VSRLVGGTEDDYLSTVSCGLVDLFSCTNKDSRNHTKRTRTLGFIVRIARKLSVRRPLFKKLFLKELWVRGKTTPPGQPRECDLSKRLDRRKESRGRSFAGRWVIHVLSRVQVEDLAPLPGPGVDRAQVLAPFHFPNRGDDAVFFHGLVGYLFILSCRRRILRIRYCGLAFRHRNFDLLLFRSLIRVEGFWHSNEEDV
jgi:hypothetical protein